MPCIGLVLKSLCLLLFWNKTLSQVLVIDAVRFTRPYDFDVLLNDIHESDLHLIAQMNGLAYLNVSDEPMPTYPVEGMIVGGHRRLMVNLMVRARRSAGNPYRNVVFLIDTGSPYTFLSRTAMEALIGEGTSHDDVPAAMRLEVHGSPSMICYTSPRDKHFADINLLGTDFLEMKGIQLQMDWAQKTFQLYDYIV